MEKQKDRSENSRGNDPQYDGGKKRSDQPACQQKRNAEQSKEEKEYCSLGNILLQFVTNQFGLKKRKGKKTM